MSKKSDNRISPMEARKIAHQVHSTKEPQFLREYRSRTEAGTRRWEFSKTRQAFHGLALDFFVAPKPGGTADKGPWAVWACPDKSAESVIAYLDDGTPCLILDPEGVDSNGHPVAVRQEPLVPKEPKPEVVDTPPESPAAENPVDEPVDDPVDEKEALRPKLIEFKAPSDPA